MMSKRVVLSFMLVLFIAGIVVVEQRTNFIRKLYDEVVLDNKNHYLTCEQLPEASEVERVVENHQEIILEIKEVNPGFVEVWIDIYTCPSKADILIEYPSHADKIAIEKIIGGGSFFGIPYRLKNY